MIKRIQGIIIGLCLALVGISLYNYFSYTTEQANNIINIDNNTKLKYDKYSDGTIVIRTDLKHKKALETAYNEDAAGRSDGATIAIYGRE